MNNKLVFTLLLLSILITACTVKLPQETDLPNWDVELNVPLGEKTFYADELLDDSLFTVYEDGNDSLLAFQQSGINLEKTTIGDNLTIDDIHQAFTQSIDDITVESISHQEEQSFSDVYINGFSEDQSAEIGPAHIDDTYPKGSSPTNLDDLFDFSSYGDGDNITIPQNFNFAPVYNIVNFDEFDEARFKSGYVDVQIFNNLAVELGAPIVVTLLNSDDSTRIENPAGTPITTTYTASIAANTTSPVQSIPVDNHHFPNDVLVEVTGVLCGDQATTIVNNPDNRNSSFYLEVATRELVATSAVAIIPSQTVDSSFTITIPETDHEISRGKFENGTMTLDFANSLNLNTEINIQIPDMSLDGEIFNRTVELNAASEKTIDVPLENYEIMPSNNQITLPMTFTTISTAPDKVFISKDQGIEMGVTFSASGDNIYMKEIDGKISQPPITEKGSIKLTSESHITEAVISEGELTIEINNNTVQYIEENITLELEIPELLDSDGKPLQIGPQDIIPGYNKIHINENNSLEGYKIRPLDNNDSQHLSYNLSVSVPENVYGEYDLQETILSNITMSSLSFSEVSGYFHQEPLTKQDSIALPEGNQIQSASFQSGKLSINIDNNLGLNGDLTFTVEELVHQDNENSLTVNLPMKTDQDNIEKNIDLSGYKILNESNSNQLHYATEITIPSDEEMTLKLSNNIGAEISLSNVIFQKITGYLDTVSVAIDDIKTEVDDFPDEIKDITLEQAIITLNFDTNIGARLLMDLEINSYSDGLITETLNIDHTIVPDDPLSKQLVISDAGKLLHTVPDSLLFSGNISLFGDGILTRDQYLGGVANILIPMIITVSDSTTLENDPSELSGDFPDEPQEITIHTEVTNRFDLSGKINLLISPEKSDFEKNSIIIPDTIVSFDLLRNTTFEETIELSEDKVDLFRDSSYIKNVVTLDPTDAGDNIKILTTDSLKIFMFGTVRGNLDLQDRSEE